MYEELDKEIITMISPKMKGTPSNLPKLQADISVFLDSQIKLGVAENADATLNILSNKYELVITNAHLQEAISVIKEENIATMLKTALLNNKAIVVNIG